MGSMHMATPHSWLCGQPTLRVQEYSSSPGGAQKGCDLRSRTSRASPVLLTPTGGTLQSLLPRGLAQPFAGHGDLD